MKNLLKGKYKRNNLFNPSSIDVEINVSISLIVLIDLRAFEHATKRENEQRKLDNTF